MTNAFATNYHCTINTSQAKLSDLSLGSNSCWTYVVNGSMVVKHELLEFTSYLFQNQPKPDQTKPLTSLEHQNPSSSAVDHIIKCPPSLSKCKPSSSAAKLQSINPITPHFYTRSWGRTQKCARIPSAEIIGIRLSSSGDHTPNILDLGLFAHQWKTPSTVGSCLHIDKLTTPQQDLTRTTKTGRAHGPDLVQS
jgi:hypothetical protein